MIIVSGILNFICIFERDAMEKEIYKTKKKAIQPCALRLQLSVSDLALGEKYNF